MEEPDLEVVFRRRRDACHDASSVAGDWSAWASLRKRRIEVVIAVSTALDGKGKFLRDTRIVVSGSKIVAIDLEGFAHRLRPAWFDGSANRLPAC
jgi:hypothetical protein